MAVMVSYHHRPSVPSGSDDVFFNTGSMYHLAVMMRPTTLAQRIIRQ
jgi:hypothetical protein